MAMANVAEEMVRAKVMTIKLHELSLCSSIYHFCKQWGGEVGSNDS